jgi:uncharacterized membrane protein
MNIAEFLLPGMKLYDKKEILPTVLILVILTTGIYFYPQLPEKMPTHWNIYGQVDGWASKTFAVYFFPALTLLLYLLLSFLPLMDPLKINIELFSHLYFWFKVVFVLFMGALYLITIFTGLGHQINVGQWVMIGIAALFFFLGLMMPKIKKNYTIGIRLPWTLHSEIVWDKTHKFGGGVFMVLAVLIFIISFFPGFWAFTILIIGILLMLAVLMVYSYWQWRLLERK